MHSIYEQEYSPSPEEVVDAVQAEADRQTDDCNVFERFGGRTIEGYGNQDTKEEWADVGNDMIELIRRKFKIEYELYTATDSGFYLTLKEEQQTNEIDETTTN